MLALYLWLVTWNLIWGKPCHLWTHFKFRLRWYKKSDVQATRGVSRIIVKVNSTRMRCFSFFFLCLSFFFCFQMVYQLRFSNLLLSVRCTQSYNLHTSTLNAGYDTSFCNGHSRWSKAIFTKLHVGRTLSDVQLYIPNSCSYCNYNHFM